MPTTPKTVQLPPADLQAQDQAWKDYQKRLYGRKRVRPVAQPA